MLINHPERAKQIISFEGMERRRGIIPTDIDGFIDYKSLNIFEFTGIMMLVQILV